MPSGKLTPVGKTVKQPETKGQPIKYTSSKQHELLQLGSPNEPH